MCDFPTIISSCWDRAEDRKARHVAERASAVETDGHIDDSAFAAVDGSRTRVHSVARLRRVAREPTATALSESDEEGLDISIPKELRDFQNSLLDLVLSNPVTARTVEIVSIPAPPLNFDGLRDLLKDLSQGASSAAQVEGSASAMNPSGTATSTEI